jgi:hypothetical protein
MREIDVQLVEALASHAAKPSALTRIKLIEAAKPYFSALKPGEAFPDPRGYYDAKGEALAAAEAAQKSGVFGRAALGFRLGMALGLGEPGFRPPEPLVGSDIYTAKPLIMVLVADRRHGEALAVIRVLLQAPGSAVREAMLNMLLSEMSTIARQDDLDAIEAFARMGLAAADGRDAKSSQARERFDEQLRTLANRRALDAVPDQLAAPDGARLSSGQRSEADRLFMAGLTKLATNDLVAGGGAMLAAARLYAGAWEGPLKIPEAQLGQGELGKVLYGLIETLEKEGKPEPLELAHRLKIAVTLAALAAPAEPVRAGSALDAIWAAKPDTDGNVLDSGHGHEITRLARVLIRQERFDELIEIARILQTAPDPGVAVQMTSMLTAEAREARRPDQVKQAERLARVGLALYGDEQSRADGYTTQFANLLDWVLEQSPKPDYAALLRQSAPDALPPADKQQADALFLEAVTKNLAGSRPEAALLFGQAARMYLAAWQGRIVLPEYRMYQLALASALIDHVTSNRKNANLAGAELALRLRVAILAADQDARTKPADLDSVDAGSISRIAMMQYDQGDLDPSRRLFTLLIEARDAEAIAQPASDFSSVIYGLSRAGRLNAAEAAGRFALDLYRDRGGRYDYAHARLARSHGEILTRKNKPEQAVEWLLIGWQHRDPADKFEGEQAAAALIGVLVRLGRLEEARPLIAAQAGGPATLGQAAAKWLVDLSSTPLRAFSAADRLAISRLAMTIYQRDPPKDPVDMMNAVVNLGFHEFNNNNFAVAETLYRRALAMSEAAYGLDSIRSGWNIENLAAALIAQGRIDEAEALFRRYWQIAANYKSPDPQSFAETLANLLNVLIGQGKLAEADQLSRQALERFSLPGAAEPAALASFEIARARVLRALDRPAEALALFRSAVAHNSNNRTRSSLAAALQDQGQAEEAGVIIEALLEEAKQDLFSGPYSDASQSLKTALADNLARRGQLARADALYAETIDTLANVFGPESSEYADNADNYARHLLRTNRLDQAREVAQAVLGARVALRGRVDASASDATRLAVAQAEANAAALLIRILARGRSQDDPATLAAAFTALQRAETSAAGLALARSAATQVAAAAGASEAVAVWRAAQARLAAIDIQITEAAADGARGDAARKAASAERVKADATLKRAQADLATRFPGFFDLVNPQPLALADLQGGKGLLRADEALVILTPGHAQLESAEQFGSVMVVTREGAAWADLPLNRTDLVAAIKAFHRTLDNSGDTVAAGFDPPRTEFSRADSFALYQALFGAPQIARLLSTKAQWTLAPQGAFASLPFAALVTEPPSGGASGNTDPATLRSTRWLGLQKALAVTPSVSVMYDVSHSVSAMICVRSGVVPRNVTSPSTRTATPPPRDPSSATLPPWMKSSRFGVCCVRP